MDYWYPGYRGPGKDVGFSGRIQLAWWGHLEEDEIHKIFTETHCTASVRKWNEILYLTVHTNDVGETCLDEAIGLALDLIQENAMKKIKIVHSEPAQGSGRQNVGKQEAASTRQNNAADRQAREARERLEAKRRQRARSQPMPPITSQEPADETPSLEPHEMSTHPWQLEWQPIRSRSLQASSQSEPMGHGWTASWRVERRWSESSRSSWSCWSSWSSDKWSQQPIWTEQKHYFPWSQQPNSSQQWPPTSPTAAQQDSAEEGNYEEPSQLDEPLESPIALGAKAKPRPKVKTSTHVMPDLFWLQMRGEYVRTAKPQHAEEAQPQRRSRTQPKTWGRTQPMTIQSSSQTRSRPVAGRPQAKAIRRGKIRMVLFRVKASKVTNVPVNAL